jgi:hypothetical protein
LSKNSYCSKLFSLFQKFLCICILSQKFLCFNLFLLTHIIIFSRKTFSSTHVFLFIHIFSVACRKIHTCFKLIQNFVSNFFTSPSSRNSQKLSTLLLTLLPNNMNQTSNKTISFKPFCNESYQMDEDQCTKSPYNLYIIFNFYKQKLYELKILTVTKIWTLKKLVMQIWIIIIKVINYTINYNNCL